jgi:maltokinase
VVSEARRELGLEDGEPRPFAHELGRLTARMHLALAGVGPPEGISRELATAAYDEAVAALDEAIEVTAQLDPASHALLTKVGEHIIWDLGGTWAMAGHAAWPIHGDLHVGQVLRTPNGRLHVIDFDGNPTRSPALRMAPAPRERDLASMDLSLENVGYVVRHYAPEIDPAAVLAWVRRTKSEFLVGYLEHIDNSGFEDQMRSFDIEQVCREFVYAGRHLPDWVYVPAAALAERFGDD